MFIWLVLRGKSLSTGKVLDYNIILDYNKNMINKLYIYIGLEEKTAQKLKKEKPAELSMTEFIEQLLVSKVALKDNK